MCVLVLILVLVLGVGACVCVLAVVFPVGVFMLVWECSYLLYVYMYVRTYLYPGVWVNYGWIKGKSVLTFVMYVAQVTDICTLPN